MHIVNIHEAKTQLSRLLEEVASGQDVIIARAGQPVARLSAYQPPHRQISPPGGMAGEIWMAEDFDAPLDDLFDCLSDPR
jgi:prevent-host-death family protein